MQTPPIAIGGIGGSGTRVIASILLNLGFHLGDDLNESLDNLLFTLLFKRMSLWPPEQHRDDVEQLVRLFLKRATDQSVLSEAEQQLVTTCVSEATDEHPLAWRQQRRDKLSETETPDVEVAKWGWKEPNTHIFLPAIMRGIPDLKYVHVMRHGVDMAFSPNQNQLKLWGPSLLGREVDVNNPSDSLSYWCAVHERLLDFQKGTDDRLLILNFDEFCRAPVEGLQTLAAFIGLTVESGVISRLSSDVNPPESIGRYKQSDLAQFAEQDLECVRKLGFVV